MGDDKAVADILDRVPELSLKRFTHGDAAERDQFITELFRGFRYFGFIILKDHGVSADLLKQAYALAEQYFAQPEAEKKRHNAGPDGQRGYTPFGREHAKDTPTPDLKEFWHVGREFAASSPLAAQYPPNIWPDNPANFKDVMLKLYNALEEAGHVMLEALAPSLGVPRAYFRDLATNGNSILRILHYPPIADDA
ncbi:MAG: 2-oxoglutarate and iron-dependent oxygenase domain-containing protein, partial [Pseudomonadota bacterium]